MYDDYVLNELLMPGSSQHLHDKGLIGCLETPAVELLFRKSWFETNTVDK